MDITIDTNATPDNDNARTFRSIKDLLCDACGEREATRDGYCEECIADVNAMIDERRGVDDWKGPRF